MFVDPASGFRRAGEADKIDVGGLDERRASLVAETVDDVQDAWGKELPTELAEERSRQRRVLRGLQYGRVAAEHGGKDLPRVVRKRRIEGDDQRCDADRPARRQDRSVRHRRSGRAPVQPAPFARDEEPHLDRRVRLAERELDRLAGLLRDELGCLVTPRLQGERDLAHEPATLDRCFRRPTSLRRSSGGNGGLDLRCARSWHAAKERPVRRPQLVESAAGGCGNAAPADEILDLLHLSAYGHAYASLTDDGGAEQSYSTADHTRCRRARRPPGRRTRHCHRIPRPGARPYGSSSGGSLRRRRTGTTRRSRLGTALQTGGASRSVALEW